MLHSVESYEFLALYGILDYHLSAGDFGCVKAVQGLTHAVEQIVGDVDDIVDGAQTDGRECVLEPLGRFLDGDPIDGDAAIARTCIGVLDLNGYATLGSLDGERVDIGTCEA